MNIGKMALEAMKQSGLKVYETLVLYTTNMYRSTTQDLWLLTGLVSKICQLASGKEWQWEGLF